MSAAAVLLALVGTGAATGGVSFPRVAADARLAVLGPRDGRAAGAEAALNRIWRLEAATYERWGDDPDGPRPHLMALALAHASAAEAQLEGVVPRPVVAALTRDRAACHVATPDRTVPATAAAFLDDFRAHRPAMADAFKTVPGTRAVFAAALALPGEPVRFDPADSPYATAFCYKRNGTHYIGVSSKLRPGGAGDYLSAPLYEAFNIHNRPASDRLLWGAGAGWIDREEFVRAKWALEQLALAESFGVPVTHFRELSDAGLLGDGRGWQVFSFGQFVPPPPSWRVPTDRQQYLSHGTAYDATRLRSQARRGGDLWEASVLLDRLSMNHPDLAGGADRLAAAGRRIAEVGRADPWGALHRHLPRPVRAWLATVRGGDRLAAWCRTARAVRAAVP